MTAARLLLDRLLHRKSLPPTGPVRIDVRPPELWPSGDSLWTSPLRWLVGQRGVLSPTATTPLAQARAEFIAAMAGLVDQAAADLLNRAQHARSLRELWHLRSELYTLIACRLDQQTADLRLARVNEYFPTRATRSAPPSTLPEESHDVAQRQPG